MTKVGHKPHESQRLLLYRSSNIGAAVALANNWKVCVIPAQNVNLVPVLAYATCNLMTPNALKHLHDSLASTSACMFNY